MTWNWQRQDWPNFTWNSDIVDRLEQGFLQQSGILIG
jgi:Fic family protein